MAGATKIGKGEYAYRGYEIANDTYGWHVRKAGMDHYPWDADSKKDAMAFIDEHIETETTQSRTGMTDAELIAIDGVGWAWLEQKEHIHEPVKES